jgi:hypothetical protein
LDKRAEVSGGAPGPSDVHGLEGLSSVDMPPLGDANDLPF